MGQIEMTDRMYLVRFKPPELGSQAVAAAKVEIHGEHIVLRNSTGKLAALFLMEIVESWSEFPLHCEYGGAGSGPGRRSKCA